ncbi:alpha-2-macroglobulin [Chromobacterium sp. IIBBL 290-4]|uniref:alpha-2-macroglobulin family protein n=1 Tax=Chromobacterium sp. IIBBL 290-4 TaxID=2953890 RepID=UPI0020B8867E|nr:MG2 domain-containing protein [Chromobacterium sp. IIBBL 290-4]UTH73206.1 MG2 domain-containing protein [Chromobacterium sp. IIBBL 290-4]
MNNTARLLPAIALFASLSVSAGVATFSPQGEIKEASQIRATFSDSMIALGNSAAPAPFSWNCKLAGKDHWVDDKTWALDLAASPAANTDCRFTLKPGLKDAQGKAVSGPVFRFFTGQPVITDHWPSSDRIEEDQAFALRLNAVGVSAASLYCQSSSLPERIPVEPLPAADRAALLKHLDLQKDAARVLTVRCAQRLAPDSKLALIHPRGSAKPDKLNFHVRPAFSAAMSCERASAKGPCIPFKPITLNFSSPVPAKQAMAIRLSGGGAERAPQAQGRNKGEPMDSVSFAPPFPALETLSLKLPNDLRDEVDRPLVNAARFPLDVKMGDYPPLAKFSAAPFGIIESGADASLPITLRGVEANLKIQSIQLGGQALRLNRDADMMVWLAKVQRYHESALPAGKDKTIESRRLSLLNKNRDAQPLKLPTQPDKNGKWPFEVVGIPLPKPGLYVVEVSSRLLGKSLLGADKPMYVRTAALVTNMAVHLKKSGENAAVWVTRLDNGKPVPNAAIHVYNCQGAALWSGKADKSGIAAIPAKLDPGSCSGQDEELSGLFVTARAKDDRGNDDVSFVRSGWNRGIESWRFPFPTQWGDNPSILAHTILDRPLFRAGETVSMKHLLRVQGGKGLSMLKPGQLPQQLRIIHDGSGDEVTLPLTWRAGRYAETSYAIPKEAKLGEYTLYLERKAARGPDDKDKPASPELDGYSLHSGGFRVEEFRLPVMTGRIFSAKGANIAPKQLPLSVAMAWGNGGPAKDWPVEVSAMLSDSYTRHKEYEGFSFSPPQAEQDKREASLDGKVVLDKAALKLDANGNGKVAIDKLPALDRRYDLVTEAAYRDPNGETQTISRRIALWPSALQVGVSVDSWITAGRSLQLKAVVLDTAGKPVAGKDVKITQREHRYLSTRKRLVGGFYAWDSNEETEDKGKVCSGTSDARGLVFCDISLKDAGDMELIAEAKDEQGNAARASQSVWVSRQDELWFDADNNDRIDILAEKTSYQPGETARFQVRMPFRKATAWLAIEREGILETRVVELEGKNPTIELKVQPDWTPNVYVSVLAVRGRVRDVPWYSFFTWGWKSPSEWWDAYWNEGGDYAPPTAMVDLSRPAFKYGIAEIQVGDAAKRLNVTVSPAKKTYGIRETAEVAIQVKLPNGKPAPAGTEVAFAAVDEALLELQPNHSWELMQAMYQRHSYGVETATAQLEVVGKRHYGRKSLPPGGGGGKAPTRELLDTLLLWQPSVKLDANGSARVKVTINDALTRFRLVAVADVGNELFGTGEAGFNVTQDLQLSSGLPPLAREGDQFQASVTVRNGGDKALKIKVSASAPGLPALPARELTLPVGEARPVNWPVTVPEGVKELKWTFSAQQVDGKAADKLAISQPIDPAVPVTVEQATLQRVSPDLAIPVAPPPGALPGRGGIRVSLQAKLGNSLPAVRRWFEDYPYACLEQRTSVSLGLADAKRWSQLMSELPLYIDGNGLAAYFPLPEGAADRGSDVLTSYLLSVANEAGIDIPDSPRGKMLDGLSAFVEGKLKRELPIGRQDADARRLAALDALSRYGRFRPAMLDALDPNPQKMSTAMLVDWLSLLNRAADIPQRASRITEASNLLRARLTYQGTKMNFSTEAEDYAWWLMGSGDVNAAKLLLTARKLPDWQADMPRLLTGLLARQQKGHWGTTTANLWGSLAVAQFSRQFETTPVGGQTRAQLGANNLSLTWPQEGIKQLGLLPWPAAPGSLQLKHAGAGAPWATIQAEAAIPLKTSRYAGYSVKKTLTPVSQKTPGQYQPGDVVKVTLDIRAQSDMSWVVVDDPVPAGASIQGSGLGRDSAIDTKDGNGGDYADYIERRFAGYRAYYSYVPRGELKVEYTMRLNNVGAFKLPPTRVEAMYAPEVFGMAPNGVFKVTDGK